MADKYYWIGSTGPFKYDDASSVNDSNLLFDGIAAPTQAPIITTGQLNIATAPSVSGNVLRYDDLSSGVVGDVTGPAGATDNAVARFDSATGKLLQSSVVVIDDSGNITGVVDLTTSGNLTLNNATATRILATDASKQAASVASLTSWIAGTANEIAVNDDGDGTVTIEGDGSNTDFTVVTAIQAGGAGGVGFQYKTRALTLNGGIISAVGAESGWNDV